MSRPIRVLIVDDSALVRQALTQLLEAAGFEVAGRASDPYQAASRLKETIPDVILLDIEMPRMDGLTFLRALMRRHPIPTVICSSLAQAGSPTVLAAMDAGAVDVVLKPAVTTREFFEQSKDHIAEVVRGAAVAKVRVRAERRHESASLAALDRPPAPRDPHSTAMRVARRAMLRTTERVILVGASTGGTEAIKTFLDSFGPDCPAIAVTQHMPPGFTRSFARRLDHECRMHVREAEDGEPLIPGQVLIAPGDRHMVVDRSGARYFVRILDTPPINRHRPSVDVLFDSGAECLGGNGVGVIMTGMGDDGARGLLRMRQAGAFTLAQDEASSIVYGMPKEAARIGAACEVLALDALGPRALVAADGSETKALKA